MQMWFVLTAPTADCRDSEGSRVRWPKLSKPVQFRSL